MVNKAEIMDANAMRRATSRISHEIIERNRGVDDVVLIGIHKKGLALALRIAQKIKEVEGNDVKVGNLDISLYKEDLSLIEERQIDNQANFDFAIENKNVVLIDDVIFTGKTAHTAIDAIMNTSKVKSIQLAVLIDRGHRALPIRPDYIGKNVPTAKNEIVNVKISDIDGISIVTISDLKYQH